MHPKVAPALRRFLGREEGVVNFMYLDKSTRRGSRLVTTGIGCLIDPVSMATPLQWYRRQEVNNASARPVANRDVIAEWNRVKGMQNHGMGPRETGWAFQGVTTLRLREAAIDALFSQRVNLFAHEMRHSARLRQFDTFPADAQLALVAHAWGLGPRGVAPTHVGAACAARDWWLAAEHAGWRDAGRERVRQLRIMFTNAAILEDPSYRQAYQHGQMCWPTALQGIRRRRT